MVCDAVWAQGFIRCKSLLRIYYFFLINEKLKKWVYWVNLVGDSDDWMERASFSLYGDSLLRNLRWPKAYRNLCHTWGSNVRGLRVHIRSSSKELSLVCSGSVNFVWSVLYALSRSHIKCLSDGICIRGCISFTPRAVCLIFCVILPEQKIK